MKAFLFLIIAVVGIRHAFLESNPSMRSSAGVELPSWFQPDSMTEAQKVDLRGQLEGALSEMEAFIANPPERDEE